MKDVDAVTLLGRAAQEAAVPQRLRAGRVVVEVVVHVRRQSAGKIKRFKKDVPFQANIFVFVTKQSDLHLNCHKLLAKQLIGHITACNYWKICLKLPIVIKIDSSSVNT